ncbi:MAG: hypothetical protein ACYCWE_04620 [Eubacteriales bacterium]
MKIKQMISILLTTAMITAVCVTTLACSDAAADDTSAQSSTVSGETTAAEEDVDSLAARQSVSDNVETEDYEGRTFHIIGDDACTDWYTREEMTGDVLEDAIYQRNLAVTERFNIAIDAVVYEESSQPGMLKKSVLAGDDAFHLYAGHIIYAGQAVGDDLYHNWYEIPVIDFEKPWWSQSTIDDLTYASKAFLAMGDFALTTIDSTYAMYFNKQFAENYDLPDMYSMVNDGKWTADKLKELSANVYSDLNGNGASDMEDQFGYAIWARSPVNVYLWAFGEKLCKKQPDGTMELDYYNTKVVDIYNRLYDLHWNSAGTYTDINPNEKIATKMFLNNQVLFYPELFGFAAGELRDFETDYGIIPYPKWDEAQDSYYTMVDGGHEALAIPASVQDTEFVGKITEVLSAESWKRVVPTYYDIVLKTKGSRDEESVAMLDKIFEKRVFDFGYVYGIFGAAFWVQFLIYDKSADIASYYEKNHKTYDKRMEQVFEYFDEYGTN